MNRLQALFRHPDTRRGARDMLVFGPGIGAWGLVAGVAMVKSGLSAPLAALMSLTVYAGSAQLASLPLIAAGAPVWVIWASAFCVNLRFVIYSAQWRVHFDHLPRAQRLLLGYFAADVNLVAFRKAYPRPVAQPGQIPYFAGGALTLWALWQVTSLAGIFAADTIPTHWGLGFAGTLAVLGLTYGLLTDRSSWVAAVVSGTAAVAAFSLPLKLNIMVAIAAAVAAGVMMEQLGRARQRMRGAA